MLHHLRLNVALGVIIAFALCSSPFVLALPLPHVVLSSGSSSSNCTGIPNHLKVNCGHMGTTKQQCLNQGCCWTPEGQDSSTPWCFTHHPRAPCNITFKTSTTSATAPLSEEAMKNITKFFLKNLDIDGKGGVVASPDTHTPGGSYYYHWMRDGALSMRTLMTIMEESGGNSDAILKYMKSYTKWVIAQQGYTDPNGVDIRVEPKFFLPNGGPYTEGWCRPQSDGPGLRSITLVKFAFWMINKQNGTKYVEENLYGTNATRGGAIFDDVQFLLTNWKMNTCDLWEEVQSTDFFWNRFVFRRAFLDAAKLATHLGDTTNAAKYTKEAAKVEATLQAHWNGDFVYESTNRKQDAAVVTAFNNGYVGDDVFPPHGEEVAGTINTLNHLFCNAFPINQADTAKGIPGMLYGRYQGDSYAGGNPWILTTGSLAQVFYRAAVAISTKSVPTVKVNHTAWAKALNVPASSWSTDEDLARSLAMAGDAVLQRIDHHVKSYGYHLSEQLDKTTGKEASATDLTWSFATVLKAMVSRKHAMKALGSW